MVPVDVDEGVRDGEAPEPYVRRLALAKARAGAGAQPGALVLGADTIVVVDGRILGKPADGREATAMLEQLSGRAHIVLTGVALVGTATEEVRVSQTEVRFAPLSSAEIAWYVATGEPLDKAGAYGIQGRAGRFVDGISGSYSNVVGLPVEVVARLLPPGY